MRKILIRGLAISITLLFFASLAPSVYALSLNKPFGGRVILRTVCSSGWGIIVGPPKGGPYVFIDGVSKLYDYRSAVIPNWVLGLAGAIPVPCFIGGGGIFGIFGSIIPNPLMPVGFPIIHIGTSKSLSF